VGSDSKNGVRHQRALSPRLSMMMIHVDKIVVLGKNVLLPAVKSSSSWCCHGRSLQETGLALVQWLDPVSWRLDLADLRNLTPCHPALGHSTLRSFHMHQFSHINYNNDNSRDNNKNCWSQGTKKFLNCKQYFWLTQSQLTKLTFITKNCSYINYTKFIFAYMKKMLNKHTRSKSATNR